MEDNTCVHGNSLGLDSMCAKCEEAHPGFVKKLIFSQQSHQVGPSANKYDDGKQPWDLVPYDALDEVVSVLKEGAKKYAPRNWEKGMSWSRCFAACMRHLWKWFHGEDKDPEWGLSHLAHAGCCILFLLAYEKRKTGIDDRPCNKTT